MKCSRAALLGALLISLSVARADDLATSVQSDYDDFLFDLWDHFHRNPELSLVEFRTAERMARELRAVGYDVTEKIGGTGLVAMLENGAGPLVMMRADMDGLPVEEASGLPNASIAQQRSPITGKVVNTMHACGHDVHLASLVGTARQMASRMDEWRGSLMLVAWCSRPRSAAWEPG
jgi:hippurate hydrolase